MIDSYAIALKRQPSAAFEHSNVCACANANANARGFDDAIEHSDVDGMTVETFATMASNFVDAVRQLRPRHLSTPVGPNSCDSASG